MRPYVELRIKLYLDDPTDVAIRKQLVLFPEGKRSHEIKKILVEHFGAKDFVAERTVSITSIAGMNEIPVVEQNISSTTQPRPVKSSKLVL